jgi:hypothetical protein
MPHWDRSVKPHRHILKTNRCDALPLPEQPIEIIDIRKTTFVRHFIELYMPFRKQFKHMIDVVVQKKESGVQP